MGGMQPATPVVEAPVVDAPVVEFPLAALLLPSARGAEFEHPPHTIITHKKKSAKIPSGRVIQAS
jgi:hypothetical protein